ncbi:DUF3710 domain-containing protein [Nocardioides panacis]|uniref:DUF3710 domain-containing protein n=1 Tax=Nocardioides panacis TaxID=2849501 RepID=A0A975Y1K2_9ACTN|nr:DUF3710 domain-containing protein [Nocardioides panacis]QWZ09484.1 DUF3710 domain-containing protein [Nocardioides panacis]
MFKRKKSGETPADAAETPEETRTGPRANGPWDVSEVTVPEDDPDRIDLGSLLLTPHPGLDLQLQVDEASGQVVAVILAGETGAAELRAFAAPRNGDIWDDVRRQVAGEVARMGGTASETEGAWGTEVVVNLTVARDDGQPVQQTSKVIGIPGPRWLLRATLFGRPAVEHQEDGDVEAALRAVVVVRGSTPVPPGDPLPLTMPPNAQRMEPGA